MKAIVAILIITNLLLAKDNLFERKNYFPINTKIDLVYDSSFGEVTNSIRMINDTIQIVNEAEDFFYAQKMLIKNDSVYVVETHQKFSVLLFINRENKISYQNPLLRIPFPLLANNDWESTTKQFTGKYNSQVTMSGNFVSEEKLKTKIGLFDTIKIITTVKTSYGSENVITEWYAKDIGLVKAEIQVKGGGFTGFLRDLLGYDLITFDISNIKYKSGS